MLVLMTEPLAYLRPLFVERQQFRQRWLWILILCVSVVLCGLATAMMLAMRVLPMFVGATFVFIPVALMIAFYLAASLVVRVDADGVHVRFFPLRKLTIPHARIASVQACDYDPIGEFGGWGIKGPRGRWGWCYTVSGRRGVRLELDNRDRLLIGSQRADELASAIQQCLVAT